MYDFNDNDVPILHKTILGLDERFLEYINYLYENDKLDSDNVFLQNIYNLYQTTNKITASLEMK